KCLPCFLVRERDRGIRVRTSAPASCRRAWGHNRETCTTNTRHTETLLPNKQLSPARTDATCYGRKEDNSSSVSRRSFCKFCRNFGEAPTDIFIAEPLANAPC